jgi:hypothetical protein
VLVDDVEDELLVLLDVEVEVLEVLNVDAKI